MYYTKNPYFLYHYTKIYKPLKDVVIEVAKRALENSLKKPLGRRTYKKKVDCIKDKGSKKPKK